MKHCLLVIGLFIWSHSGFLAQAQSQKIEDISKLSSKNVGVLQSDGEVSGYYLFNSLGKASKGMKTFRLTIFDPELNITSTAEFQEAKNLMLVEGISSDSHILVKFVDHMKYRSVMMIFDNVGQLISKIDHPWDQKKRRGPAVNIYGNRYEVYNLKQMHSVRGGFVHYMPWNKGVYHIDFIATENDNASWEYVNTEDRAGYQHLAFTEDLILNTLLKPAPKKDQAPDFYIQALDVQTGEERYRIHVDNTYRPQPIAVYDDSQDGVINVLGLYFDPDRKKIYSNSLGMFNYQINTEGEVLDKRYVPWASGLAQKLGMDKKGKTEGGFLYFHEIIPHADGSFLIVAEQFRRTADALGITFALINSNASVTKMVVEDLMIIELNPDFSLKNAHTIEKDPRSFDLHGHYAVASKSFGNVYAIAQDMDREGGFDYKFSQELNQDGLSVHYRSIEKGTNERYMGSVRYQNQEITLEKHTLEGWTLNIFPGTKDRVAVFHYVNKENILNIYLKKVSLGEMVGN